MEFAPIKPHQDAAMAAIVRAALKEHGLDKPGTAYFDASLDHLSAYYDRPGRAYYVLLDGETAFHGRGLGSQMIRYIEDRARALGYRQIYLETHTALQAALRAYERCGYRSIPRPSSVIHTTMDRFYLKEL